MKFWVREVSIYDRLVLHLLKSPFCHSIHSASYTIALYARHCCTSSIVSPIFCTNASKLRAFIILFDLYNEHEDVHKHIIRSLKMHRCIIH